MEYYRALLELSQWLGDNWLLTQASGGNTSVKCSEDIWIKSSGSWLNKSLSDPEVFTLISSENGVRGSRPSMELPFHLAIPHKFVCHYHSVYFLLCSISGSSKEFLQHQALHGNTDACVIEYKEPGQALFSGISSLISRLSCAPNIILLENHGVVVSSDSSEDCIEVITSVNDSLRCFLGPRFPGLFKYHDVFFRNDYSSHLQQLKSSIVLSRNMLMLLRESLLSVPTNSAFFPDQVVTLGFTQSLFSMERINQFIESSKDVDILECATYHTSLVLRGNPSAKEYYALTTLLLVLLSAKNSVDIKNTLCESECLALLSSPDEIYRKERMGQAS